MLNYQILHHVIIRSLYVIFPLFLFCIINISFILFSDWKNIDFLFLKKAFRLVHVNVQFPILIILLRFGHGIAEHIDDLVKIDLFKLLNMTSGLCTASFTRNFAALWTSSKLLLTEITIPRCFL